MSPPRRLSPTLPGAHPILPAVVIGLLFSACTAAAPDATSTTVAPAVTEGTEVTSTSAVGETTTTAPTSSSTTTTAPEARAIEIVIEGGEVLVGPETLEVELGSTVHLVVTSDQEEHLHVHGYDLFFELAPGAATEVVFTADIAGIFEVELEGSHLLVLELEVS